MIFFLYFTIIFKFKNFKIKKKNFDYRFFYFKHLNRYTEFGRFFFIWLWILKLFFCIYFWLNNIPFLWNHNNAICTENAFVWFKHSLLYKHTWMIRTQVLTTYLMHFFRVWVSTRPPPLFFKRKKKPKRMNKQSRLFPILKPLNTKFGKSRTNARTWHPTGTHWVTAIQPLKSTDYIFYLGLHDFCWHLLCMLALHTQTHIANYT